MQKPHGLVAGRLEGSVFTLAFETEQMVGYWHGLRNGVLRALHINLERRTLECELMQRGLPTKSRVEYFPTLTELIERLPVTIDSFDLKFKGLRLKEDKGPVAQTRHRVRLAENADPWELVNYYDTPHVEEPREGTRLRFVDEKFK